MNRIFSDQMLKKLSFVLFLFGNLLFASVVLAQSGEAVPPPPTLGQTLFQMLPMIACLLLVYHLMVIKPQRDEERRHAELLNNLKDGQQVVTSGGIIGRVAGTGEDYVLLDVGNRIKIKVEKEQIEKKRSSE